MDAGKFDPLQRDLAGLFFWLRSKNRALHLAPPKFSKPRIRAAHEKNRRPLKGKGGLFLYSEQRGGIV